MSENFPWKKARIGCYYEAMVTSGLGGSEWHDDNQYFPHEFEVFEK